MPLGAQLCRIVGFSQMIAFVPGGAYGHLLKS